MPLYEYECAQCGAMTETLRRVVEADEPLACDHCGHRKCTRKLSVFTAGSSNGSAGSAPEAGPGSCGHCGGAPGSCMSQ